MNERIKENIKYLTEWLRILVLMLATIFTSVVSLLQKWMNTPIFTKLLIIGILIVVVLFYLILYIAQQIDSNIKKL